MVIKILGKNNTISSNSYNDNGSSCGHMYGDTYDSEYSLERHFVILTHMNH